MTALSCPEIMYRQAFFRQDPKSLRCGQSCKLSNCFRWGMSMREFMPSSCRIIGFSEARRKPIVCHDWY